MRTIEYANVIT